MHFETIEAISLAGTAGRPNNDRLGAATRMAWVIDGATDLGPPGLLGHEGGADWLATAAATAFAGAAGARLEEICATVFGQIEHAFAAARRRAPVAAWEMPKAAFAAAHLSEGALEVAWAADCTILHVARDGLRWTTDAPDGRAEAADAAALGPGVGAEPERPEAVLADRRAHRGREDHAAIGAVAARSRAATRHAAGPVAAGDEVLLMTDGFASLVSPYGRHSAESLVAELRGGGLAALALELRAIERADAACLRHPRFKPSDDATALWLRVAG